MHSPDLGQDRIVEDFRRVPVALPERPPRLGGDSALRVDAPQFGLLEVGMQLDLVDRRCDTGRVDDPLQLRRGEVRDTDRSPPSVLAQLSQRPPGLDEAFSRARRPVDEVEVDVV